MKWAWLTESERVEGVTGHRLAQQSILEMSCEQRLLQDLRHPKAHSEPSEASAGHHVVPHTLGEQQSAAYKNCSPVLMTPWSCQTCASGQPERTGHLHSRRSAGDCVLDG